MRLPYITRLLESAAVTDRPSVRISEATEIGATVVRETDKPGRFLVKIIDVGEGSSAFYPAEALKLAVTDRVFTPGVHLYLDHAAALQRGPRGERSVRDLAAVIATEAYFDETEQALLCEVDFFGTHASTLREVWQNIGVSVSASAVVGPPQPGGRKPTVQRIIAVESVDFVVKAGRGGAILSLLESAALEAAAQDRREQLDMAVRDAYQDRDKDVWVGLRDFDDAAHTAWFYISDETWQQTYTVADDDMSVTLIGDRTEVRAVTTYVPVNSGGATTTTQEAFMPEITEARLTELTESHNRVGTLESERDAAIKERDAALAESAEIKTKVALEAAKAESRKKVLEACTGVAPAMVDRVADTVIATITEAEVPADLEQRVTHALEAEKAYLSGLTEGRLTGFGASESATTQPSRTHNAWGQPTTKEA